ncbi:hypothetical protein BDW72DRAFT_193749 [Aspergillus terricola var. indicus]
MCDVYWNTVCRLAVTDSKRPTEGFFPPLPILTSVRIPSLETEVQEQWEKEDSSCGPMVEKDEGEKSKEIDESDRNVIPTPAPQTGQIGGEATGKMPAYNMQDNTSNTKRRTPSPQGLGSCDSHTPPDDLDGFLARFENMTQERGSQERGHEQESQDHAPLKKYVTIPRAYAVDVDGGVVNTRGWVLQERLLAPRSIHFTKHQIYCADQDDTCGEDWIRRYFTWRSSIDKTSWFTPIELFPERYNSIEHLWENTTTRNIWSQRVGHEADNHFVPDPWLRVCEVFSKCRFTFNTDKLAAVAGLVKKKQEFCRSGSANYYFGLWEESLHVELAWVAPRKAKFKFLRSLCLPSWAWIAYEG